MGKGFPMGREDMRTILILGVAIMLAGLARDAAAQVPPHYPGTICFTAQFWCWAQQAGPPGYACVCPSAYGWVQGRLG
jgi:hypothetical protein